MLKEEGSFVKIMRRLKEERDERDRLAEELMRVLREQPREEWDATSTWFEVVQEWENVETIIAALRLCLKIIRERNPFTVRNLSRQLRRWRREEGLGEQGWLEIRKVGTSGPYVYFRWREPGERKIRTQYYGRADRLLEDLAVVAAVIRASRPNEKDEP